jgi:2-(1,2-epoxy-1,2-dihydrophenyl)acetyl-CoA isomerase
MGLSYLLPRAVGTSKALELMYTGDIIDAQEAKEIGLVSKVVPHDDLPGVTKELAIRIANGPPIAIELTKKAVYAAQETNNFASALSYESWAQEVCTASEDAQEGVRSFLEKREPVYKGK